MTTPAPADSAPEPPRLPAEPTVRVARPPAPGSARRTEVAAAGDSTPHVDGVDEPTVGLSGQAPRIRQPTMEFGTPTPVRVIVGPRPRRRRKHPLWPWIAALLLALLVLGAVLLVMLLRGATIDGEIRLIGSGGSGGPGSTAPGVAWSSGQGS